MKPNNGDFLFLSFKAAVPSLGVETPARELKMKLRRPKTINRTGTGKKNTHTKLQNYSLGNIT